MVAINEEIDIFCWRAESRIATLGNDIVLFDKQGESFVDKSFLIQQLSAAISLLQFRSALTTDDDAYQVMSLMYDRGDLIELPIQNFIGVNPTQILLQGNYFVAGPIGPQGLTGATGATGSTGPAGANGTNGINGDTGWSPVFSIYTDINRRVLKLVDWTGGTGTKPSINLYVSASGLTPTLALAIDIRGPIGASGAIGQAGPAGANGTNAYLYVAYASDSAGTDFSLLPGSTLDFIAVLQTNYIIPSPSAPDFTGLWKEYKGEKGDPFVFDAVGPSSSMSTYDNEAEGFTFLDSDTGTWFVKRTSAPADWAGPFELGPQGWSPVFSIEEDNERRVLKLVDWVGGSGIPPTEVNLYVGATGLEANIADGVDVRGSQGERFFIDAQGLLSTRTTYDAELEGFVFYATDTGLVYKKASDTSGDWTTGYPWRGPTGSTGPAGGPGTGFNEDALFATTVDLDATYSAGVLTANSNGALAIDGGSPMTSNRLLAKDQVIGSENGIYIVTDPGSISTPFVLTRATDFDTTAEVQGFLTIHIINGTDNSGTWWALSTIRHTLVLDTTYLVFDIHNGLGAAGVIYADGSVAMAADFDLGGFSIFNLDSIIDTGGNISVYVDGRQLGYSDGTTFAADWSTQTDGFKVNSKLSPAWTKFKTSNLSADRNFELPNYDFSFPTSAPASNTFLKYDGANYVWDVAGAGTVTSVSGTTNRITSTGGATPVIDISASYVGQSSITTLGTITTGTWNGTAIANANLANSSLTVNGTSISLGGSGTITAAAGTLTGATLNSTVVTSSLTTVGTIGTGVWNGTVIIGTYGGTGVNNGTKTITLGGNLTTTGAFNATFAIPQSTTWTLPNTASETLAGLGTAQSFTAQQTFTTSTTRVLGIDLLDVTYKGALDTPLTTILRIGKDFGTLAIAPITLSLGVVGSPFSITTASGVSPTWTVSSGSGSTISFTRPTVGGNSGIFSLVGLTVSYTNSSNIGGSMTYMPMTGTISLTSTANQTVTFIDINPGSFTVSASAATVYGFRSRLSTATGAVWNIYSDGTAPVGIAGKTYIGGTITTPLAYLHLAAGTATTNTAPLKLTSGTNLTTGEAGAMEYDGTTLFFTRTGTTRESILVGVSGAAAPATNTIGVVVDYYGTSATRVLTTPNSWASVVITGTTYKIPLYT